MKLFKEKDSPSLTTQGMESSSSRLSVWHEEHAAASYLPIQHDIHADVCVVGGGIAGLTTAYRLTKEGKFVVVLEDGFIGSGESGNTSAHLSNALDDHYFNIIKKHGLKRAKFAADSHTAAINFIESIVANEHIDCDFQRVNGYLFADDYDTTNGENVITKEYKAAKKVGLTNVQLLNKAPDSLKSYAANLCLMFPDQAQFHPLKYLSGLARVITRSGSKIYEQTRAVDFKLGKLITVKTAMGHTVTAKNLVIATNSPVFTKRVMYAKQESNRTYVVTALVPTGTVKAALYWDTAEPYHYVRLIKNYEGSASDLLIIGGEDHRTGFSVVPNQPFDNLENWATKHFPQITEFKHRWSGQVMEPADYMAFIGRAGSRRDNLFMATGDSGNGLTHGTIAGILLTDLIMHRHNVWEKLYSPARRKIWNSLFELFRLNFQGLKAYISYLTPGDVKSVDELKFGQAAIIRKGTTKLAVYRDECGILHKCSAVCTHKKAIVAWNPIEKTWDCPAHGSRFSVDGEVLNGPANRPLKEKR